MLDVDALCSSWPWAGPLDWAAMTAISMETDSSTNSSETSPPPTLVAHDPHDALPEPISNLQCPPASASDSPSGAVYQLSQLIARLYSLHRSSSSLTEAARPDSTRTSLCVQPQPLIINDAAFQPVAAWLIHATANVPLPGGPLHGAPDPTPTPTTGETLHGTFSASHSLLAILDRLQADAAPAANTPSPMHGLDTDFWDTTPPQSLSAFSYFDLPVPASASARPSLLHCDTVVRHLVGACHSLLLNVYIGPLDALQHDADLKLSQAPSSAGANAAPPEATDLAHLRLVTALHLCSYLIRRLQHAVAQYSSPPLAGAESPSDLDDQVWKRLTQLRKTLDIRMGGL